MPTSPKTSSRRCGPRSSAEGPLRVSARLRSGVRRINSAAARHGLSRASGHIRRRPWNTQHRPPARKPLYQSLYFQVICAIVIGVLLGHFYPALGEQMKPLGDVFIKMIKMIIAPIIFCTVVHRHRQHAGYEKGWAKPSAIKALLYFELVTTIALVVGLIVVNVLCSLASA